MANSSRCLCGKMISINCSTCQDCLELLGGYNRSEYKVPPRPELEKVGFKTPTWLKAIGFGLLAAAVPILGYLILNLFMVIGEHLSPGQFILTMIIFTSFISGILCYYDLRKKR